MNAKSMQVARSWEEQFRSQLPQFVMALGNQKSADWFLRVAITEVKRNQLDKCEPYTLLACFMLCAQLRLDPQLGEAYIIPRRNTRKNGEIVWEAQLQVGYQGYKELFYRHPLAKELYAEIVCENDKFEVELGTERKLVHIPNLKNRGNPIYYYAVAKLTTGAVDFAFLSQEEAKKHMQRYASTSDAWKKHFEEMALKTAVKKVLKLMPKSTELAKAMYADETIRYAINVKSPDELEASPVIYPEDEIIYEPEKEPITEPEKPPVVKGKLKGDQPDLETLEKQEKPEINIEEEKRELSKRIDGSNLWETEKQNILLSLMTVSDTADLEKFKKSLKLVGV